MTTSHQYFINFTGSPVQFRIRFKIILLTFKALHQLAPIYIRDMLQLRNVRPGLRSSALTLHVPISRQLAVETELFTALHLVFGTHCRLPSEHKLIPQSSNGSSKHTSSNNYLNHGLLPFGTGALEWHFLCQILCAL